MGRVSFVIPALNEVHNLAAVIGSVPVDDLKRAGWDSEIVVVDNASTDGTGAEALRLGARVIYQPRRGYGNAYHAGFAAARGDVIITGDADRTYPLDHAVALLTHLREHELDFLTTNRLLPMNRDAMKPSHTFGNAVLSAVSRALFGNGVSDSQSGMWIFRREIWPALDVRSGGMAFSQEIKNAAFAARLRCAEVPIEYRPRGGEVKLNAARDGMRNLTHLVVHRFRRPLAGGGRLALTAGPDAPFEILAAEEAPWAHSGAALVVAPVVAATPEVPEQRRPESSLPLRRRRSIARSVS